MKDIGKGPWRKGRPPSVGWWPASCTGRKEILRWWNGRLWSYPALPSDDQDDAADIARRLEPKHEQDGFRWRDRADWWPEHSRT